MTSARKIVYVVGEDWFFHSHFLPMGRAAKALGLDVIVASHLGPKAAALEAEGFRVFPLPGRRNDLSPANLIRTFWVLRRLFARERPALVHNIALLYVLVGAAAAWSSGVPGVVNAVTGLGFLGARRDGLAGVIRGALRLCLVPLLSRRNSRLLLENLQDLETLRIWGFPRRNNAVLLGGAGVDIAAFPATPEPPAPPVVITMVSRMLWSKGPDILVQAHDLLMKRGIACRLQLVGDTDPENPAGIPADLLRAWNSRPGVSWLGHRADIADIWRRSHIAVLPSRGGEGLPRALIEAAASARPIVTTDVPGCNRIVENGKSGLIVPPDDPEALADALQRLVADRELRERYGAAGRTIVERGFSLRHVTDAVTSVYTELLSRHQGRADPSGHSGQVSPR